MRETIRKLRYLLSPREQRLTAGLLFLLAGGAVLEMVSVSVIPLFVALLGAPRRLFTYLPAPLAHAIPREASDGVLIMYAALGLLGISVVKNVALAFLSLAQSRYQYARQIALSSRLLHAYLRAPYSFHLQRNSAELMRNVNLEALDVITMVVVPILTLALEGLTIVAITGVLVAREPLISVLALGLLGGTTVLFVRAVRKRLVRYGEEMHRQRGRMIQVVSEGLGGIKITKLLARESHFGAAHAREAQEYAAAARFRQTVSDLPRLYLETAAIVGLLAVAGLLLAQRRPVGAIIPILSLFAVAIVRMVPCFNRVTGAVSSLRFGRVSLTAVYDDLRRLDALAEVPADRTGGGLPFERAIRFEHVSFQYPGAARRSLVDVSLEIARGSAVGIVGPTGAGKTTFVDLVLGLLPPSSGRILVDGRDIHSNVRAWQRRVGYVPQDVYLTDDTIRRNIAIGLADNEIDDVAVQRAAEAAQLAPLVASLPEGLDTTVGERGVRLSGGQRQRIGIARALYTDPEVLVMDEATSSLDGETERFVMDAVESLRGNRTIILIAHRMTTVRDCDRLVLLSDGAVSGTGTYEEMMERSPRFRRLVTAHAGG